jgi:hypothetical protein
MTKVFINKLENKKEEKRNKKLQISHTRQKAQYKDGVLNIGKNFMKKVNKN